MRDLLPPRWRPVIKAIGYPLMVVAALCWCALVVDGVRALFGLSDPLDRVSGIALGAEPQALQGLSIAYGVRVLALLALLAVPAWLSLFWLRTRRTAVAEARAEAALRAELDARYARAIDRLGHAQRAVRLGGIYALEQVARESLSHHLPVMQALAAYVRTNAPASMAPAPLPAWDAALSGEDAREAAFEAHFGKRPFSLDDALAQWVDALPGPEADIQAALTILARRSAAGRAQEHQDGRRIPIDLRDSYLARADLSNAQLDGVLLSGAHLAGATLSEATLERASLAGAHLEQVRLDEARMDGADLSGAWLQKADLRWADLENASLQDAHLEHAMLVEAHFERAELKGACLTQAVLRGAVGVEAGLRGAALDRAILTSARLEGADLRGANLQRAALGGTDFEKATLVGARFDGAEMRHGFLGDADLRGAVFAGTVLRDTAITGATLRSTDLSGARELDPETLDETFGVKAGAGRTLLPEGVAPPEHWFDARDDATLDAYEDALRAWRGEDEDGAEERDEDAD
ncbi:MAG: pentapeptide repeat-containing protein [Pseudomonadota bacterium]